MTPAIVLCFWHLWTRYFYHSINCASYHVLQFVNIRLYSNNRFFFSILGYNWSYGTWKVTVYYCTAASQILMTLLMRVMDDILFRISGSSSGVGKRWANICGYAALNFFNFLRFSRWLIFLSFNVCSRRSSMAAWTPETFSFSYTLLGTRLQKVTGYGSSPASIRLVTNDW